VVVTVTIPLTRQELSQLVLALRLLKCLQLAVVVAVAVDICRIQMHMVVVALALVVTHLVRRSLLSQATTQSL
jgi:hypothetical protein